MGGCLTALTHAPGFSSLQVLDLGRLDSWSYLRGLILAVSFQEKEMLFSFACSATPPVGLDNQTSASFCPYMGGNLLGERGGTEHASVLLGKPFLSIRDPPLLSPSLRSVSHIPPAVQPDAGNGTCYP